MAERKFTVTEVSMIIGTSTRTINTWYRWKALHPNHEMAKLLPEFTRGVRQARYWTESDIYKLNEFKTSIPQGRYGIMGEVTQKYAKPHKKTAEV